MKLMTPDEVKRRLSEGEDAVLLSLEHWLQIAQRLKQCGGISKGAHGSHTCPLCLTYDDCHNCPLLQSEGKHCCGSDGCYNVFLCDPSYDNAMGVVAALAKCKSPEPQLPQFYIWREGEEPAGKVGLRLVKLASGAIRLDAVNEDGTTARAGRLLLIHPDGSVYPPVNVGPKLGFDLDSDGRLRLQGFRE